MKIVLMTTPFFFVEESQILTALFDEGLELLHLRKPDTEPVFSERLLSLIPESYHRRIVTHDHFYLKNEYGLRGVHLNGRNLELPDGFKGTISCSCYTVDETEARRRKMDYVFLQSTDFNVPESREASWGLLEDAAHQMSEKELKKVYVSGGITLDDLPRLRSLGFGGAVVYGDIWNRFNIYSQQDYRELILHFRKLLK
ncbi:hypothetical protein HMPREF9332_00320 [Alloprevotella rava F0323]|uniref:Thiamine phosphate synthase/TenI domain-containing protein n=1 Tax=Alloprevotella rava F0323 TaxID=679199 RepID=G5G9R9_9BACT|nr:thiamine phosphate synthase [Alloprevotella rava]EHG24119.1 hypothetical protein HMPREF9332_00320 [Alloprevotella rava F0323]